MKFKLLIPCLLLFLMACQEIVEKDISGNRVTVLTPANNFVSSTFSTHFKWEALSGASEYRLQIVGPNFGNIQNFVLDSSIAGTEFTYTLEPGTYQWRIRGENSISQCEYVTRNITIDSTLDLSGQNVILISPADNYSTNVLANTFTWQTMPNADNYIFQVLSLGTVINTNTTTSTTSSYTFAAEGNYQWRVFAQNATSTSGFSTYDITIDQTPPVAPVLSLPLANDTSANPVALSWVSETGTVADSVMIYADTNLTTLVDAQLVTTQTYSFTGISGADYFWRVRSKDAAGNWGVYATRRKFIVFP